MISRIHLNLVLMRDNLQNNGMLNCEDYMKKLIIGIVIGFILSASVSFAFSVIPNDLWARMFNSFKLDNNGDVAVRAILS